MKLSRWVIYAATTGAIAVAAGLYFLSPSAHSGADSDVDSRREVIRNVAKSFESMAQAGKDLPVPDPSRLRVAAMAVPSKQPVSEVWSDFASRRGFAAYETELQSHGDSSSASVSAQRLLVLNHIGTGESVEAAQGFAQEAFSELHARPEESVQAIGRLLESMPLERTEERIYLLQLGSRLDNPDDGNHAQVTSMLREEIALGVGQGSTPEVRSSAASAVIELVNMGEMLPDVSELARENVALSQILTRTGAAAPQPQGQ